MVKWQIFFSLHFERKRIFFCFLLEYKSVNCKRLDDKQTEELLGNAMRHILRATIAFELLNDAWQKNCWKLFRYSAWRFFAGKSFSVKTTNKCFRCFNVCGFKTRNSFIDLMQFSRVPTKSALRCQIDLMHLES